MYFSMMQACFNQIKLVFFTTLFALKVHFTFIETKHNFSIYTGIKSHTNLHNCSLMKFNLNKNGKRLTLKSSTDEEICAVYQ